MVAQLRQRLLIPAAVLGCCRTHWIIGTTLFHVSQQGMQVFLGGDRDLAGMAPDVTGGCRMVESETQASAALAFVTTCAGSVEPNNRALRNFRRMGGKRGTERKQGKTSGFHET